MKTLNDYYEEGWVNVYIDSFDLIILGKGNQRMLYDISKHRVILIYHIRKE